MGAGTFDEQRSGTSAASGARAAARGGARGLSSETARHTSVIVAPPRGRPRAVSVIGRPTPTAIATRTRYHEEPCRRLRQPKR